MNTKEDTIMDKWHICAKKWVYNFSESACWLHYDGKPYLWSESPRAYFKDGLLKIFYHHSIENHLEPEEADAYAEELQKTLRKWLRQYVPKNDMIVVVDRMWCRKDKGSKFEVQLYAKMKEHPSDEWIEEFKQTLKEDYEDR